MDKQFLNDLDYFAGAFSEFCLIAAEQVKGQPVMQFDCIGVLLQSQLQALVHRAYALSGAKNDESNL